MKGICKRVVSCFSAVTMLAAAFGTMAVTASKPQGPAPEVSWSESGETYPRTAQLGISYLNGSAYNGQYSLTALYNDSDKLVGIGSGQLDANGAANYPVSIAEAGAANVKCFIWNDSASIKPVTPVYETTYKKFTNLKPLVILNSFENGLFRIFQNKKSDLYTAEIVEGEGAYTGTKYAKVSNRNTESATLRVKLPKDETSLKTTINVKAFMKKPDNVAGNAEFYINIITPRTEANGGKLTNQSTPVIASDNEWHEVSYVLDLSKIENISGDCVIELGARTGSEGSYNYNVDYYADDFTVVCPNAKQPSVFDDTKVDRLKWDFENGATADWVTVNRTMAQMKDTNKWTRVLNAQTLKVESTSAAEFRNTASSTTDTSVNTPDKDAVTTPPEGSTQMLTTETDSTADNKNAHVTARIKLSRLDLIPNKTYQISFWAFGNSKPRALYIGLVEHSDTIENPSSFYGSDAKYNYLAGGIIDYNGDYTKNRVAIMPRSWHKYTYTITPAESSFNSDGYTDLCFVMTGDKTLSGSTYDSKDMLNGEKLYLDEIEITESSSSQVAAIANDGLYTKRATFESDNMDMFSPQTRSSVVLTTAAANTGSYSAEFANRKDNWTSLGSSLKGADLSSKITASCYLKKNSLRA